jgi:hypothetical protein
MQITPNQFAFEKISPNSENSVYSKLCMKENAVLMCGHIFSRFE